MNTSIARNFIKATKMLNQTSCKITDWDGIGGIEIQFRKDGRITREWMTEGEAVKLISNVLNKLKQEK